MMFSVKREESLRSQAAQQIRDAIVIGKLAPGTMHSEQTIAAEMGISRTPVREALLQLAGEGLVEFVPHRGVRISRLDLDHLVGVMEYRAALESYCAAGLARDPRPEMIAALDARIAEQRQVIESGDRLRWVSANIAFHRALVDSLGNRLMSEAFPALAAHTMRIGYRMIARQERMQESVDEHLATVNAIRRGDVEEARRLAADHLRITKLLMKQLFDDLQIDVVQKGDDRARA